MPWREDREAFLVIINLPKSYASRYGSPVVHSVDTDIFVRTYYTFCQTCNFCHDDCCSHGVDVDLTNVRRIEMYAEQLEDYAGSKRNTWFAQEYTIDKEFPGGAYTRTAVVNDSCVFHHPEGKGCLLHSFCVRHDIDYHKLKPMVSCLFPLTFDDGLLHAAEEAGDGSLLCLGDGPTLYRGVRDEVVYFFGADLAKELDELEQTIDRSAAQEIQLYHSLRR